MIEDTELREILRGTAANATLPAEMPQSMRRKVTQRRARSIGITCLVSVGIAVGALQVMQAVTLQDAAPIPPANETGNKDPGVITFNFPTDVGVSLHVDEPWTEHTPAPDGSPVKTNGAWLEDTALVFDGNPEERLGLTADPTSVGSACQSGPADDAETLARLIRNDTDLEATAPVRVSVGGVDALRMDVTVASGAHPCSKWGAGYPESPMVLHGFMRSRGAPLEEGSRMRLYLLDTPWRSANWSRQVFALWIVAPESRFEDVAEAAQSILDSIEFQAR